MARGEYQLKNLKKETDILSFDWTGSQYDCMVVIIDASRIQTDHVIGIVSNTIIDGSHTHTMELSKHNLNWCCGDNRQFVGIQTGFLLRKPRKSRKKRKYFQALFVDGYNDRNLPGLNFRRKKRKAETKRV